jgi:hypothetical protein
MATKVIEPVLGSPSADVIKHRQGVVTGVTVDTTLGNCDVVDIRDYIYIAVKPSAGITSLSVYGSETEGGTYVLLDSIGTNGAVTVVASKWNTFDTIKMVPNTNGTVSVAGKT